VTDKLLDDLKDALGDAYTIERELTGGGMSRVFVAREHALGREVVIKVLPPDLAAGVNRDRFRREVQLAARLSHPYIVPLLHAGEHGQLLWFTMPYIDGESLKTVLERDGPMPVGEVIRLMHDVVEALAYAHSRGVIHRDIKPGNILYDGRHALVTDFGVAKALSAALSFGPGHTTSGMAIGTPAYMAPEQLAADPSADQRVDIYAAGLLAYELITGSSPFSAKSPTATMTAQLTRVPEPLHISRPDVPPALSQLISRCLAKSPDDRPQTAKEVLDELDKISGAMAAAEHGGGVLPPPKPASWIPLAVAMVGVACLVIAGMWLTQRNNGAAAAKPETVLIPAGSDSATQAPLKLPATPTLTRADSLRIAQALRDELGQLESAAPSTARPSNRLPSNVTFVQLDSAVRAQYRELARLQAMEMAQAGAAGAGTGAAAIPHPPNTPATPGPPSTSTRTVLVLGMVRGTDSTMRALEQGVVNDLISRLERTRTGVTPRWHVLTRDSLARPDTSGHFRGFPTADINVFVSLHHKDPDSIFLSINLRNGVPGSNNGFRVFNSDPVVNPSSIDPFRPTLHEVSRVLEFLHNIPADQPWPLDEGQHSGRFGPNGGPGGGRRGPPEGGGE
jgi:eukaryotic-like serine/threonine-protein kinase